MSWIKVIYYNFVTLFTLLGVLLLSPPIVYGTYLFFKADSEVREELRGQLPNYEGIEWADTHFKEFSELTTTYFDYITWRRDDYSGKTINIVDGLRATIKPQSVNDELGEVWFFGGSSTWGSGANDAQTFPSIFARETNARVINFGESGYIARQSYALLANQYITGSASLNQRTVVFYDGVNDVSTPCRIERRGLGTALQNEIQIKLKRVGQDKWTFLRTFAQLRDLLAAISEKVSGRSTDSVGRFYDCDTNPKKAEMVAASLVSIWEQAQKLTSANGDRFLAILQPVAFVGSPNVEHIDLDDEISVALSRQYSAVYPLIKAESEMRDINFLDLTDAYDSREFLYIDFCHVSPQGHEILVPRIIEGLRKNDLF